MRKLSIVLDIFGQSELVVVPVVSPYYRYRTNNKTVEPFSTLCKKRKLVSFPNAFHDQENARLV